MAEHLQTRGTELEHDLHGDFEGEEERSPDVIQAVGKTYYEVFDLEKMGWSDQHPTYLFARIMNEAIRSQQIMFQFCGGR